MNRFERENLKGRFLKLATLKATGTPADLAARFEIDVRSIKRMAKELREEGYEIWYCQSRGSYIMEQRN